MKANTKKFLTAQSEAEKLDSIINDGQYRVPSERKRLDKEYKKALKAEVKFGAKVTEEEFDSFLQDECCSFEEFNEHYKNFYF
jgi:major membrane immunogen (membrane-anchored lipoprotein)